MWAHKNIQIYFNKNPIQLALRSKVWVYGYTLAGIAGPSPARDVDVSVVTIECGQLKASASGWSLGRRILPTVVFECDLVTSTTRRP
jgi:hypothetical protein